MSLKAFRSVVITGLVTVNGADGQGDNYAAVQYVSIFSNFIYKANLGSFVYNLLNIFSLLYFRYMYCKLINICNVFNFAVRNREKLSTNINLFEI